jgi:hypothetical protein
MDSLLLSTAYPKYVVAVKLSGIFDFEFSIYIELKYN